VGRKFSFVPLREWGGGGRKNEKKSCQPTCEAQLDGNKTAPGALVIRDSKIAKLPNRCWKAVVLVDGKRKEGRGRQNEEKLGLEDRVLSSRRKSK